MDINLLCAMGRPGGGHNPITPQFTCHFNLLSFCEMEYVSKQRIFSTILQSWLGKIEKEEIKSFSDLIVDHTIAIYNTITTQLLPTPTKSHYTFNLRNLPKVLQGILMAQPPKIETKADMLHLWYHENCRVFQDGLVSDEVHSWFKNQLQEKLVKSFSISYDEVVTCKPLLYRDLMIPIAEIKLYGEITDREK